MATAHTAVEVAKVLGDSASQVTTTVVDAMTKGFTALAQKAGVAADHFYPVIVKQQVIEGCFFFAIVGIMTLVATILTIATVRKDWSDYGDLTKEGLGFIIAMALYFLVLIAFGVNGVHATSQVFNPEYYAVKDIIDMGQKLLHGSSVQ